LRRPTFLPAEITGIAPDAAVGEAANTGAASRTAMIAACGRGLHLLMYGSRAVLKARRAVGGGSRGLELRHRSKDATVGGPCGRPRIGSCRVSWWRRWSCGR